VRLDGKAAIITGAGSGIGRAAALLFASEGAQVAVVDIDESGAAETARLAAAANPTLPGEVRPFHGDITDPASVAAAVDAAAAAFGRLDVLYNNAGGSVMEDGAVAELSFDVWQRVIALNLTGTFLTSKYALAHLAASGGGSIINAGSYIALVGFAGRDAYTAAKGGVVALTRAMAVEYAPLAIRVNCICPGAVATERVKRFFDEDPRVQPLVDQHLLGVGRPEDIAYAALHLASDEARITTGSVMVVDSGLTAR
jgi:NAD(P)-dependent dehydrogenase (short-subunit alcohol dehydrogenase family)